MEKAKDLIRQYVTAGFSKIHIDTSMRLSSDDEAFSDEIISKRAALLAAVSEEAFRERVRSFPGSTPPVYVIGSEVPVPGGAPGRVPGSASEEADTVVTSPGRLVSTYVAFRSAFADAGLSDAFSRVVGLVVQPGVEFGGEHITHYDRIAAKKLTQKLLDFDGIVFEGHSTDYQTREKLREMVEDGIAILKVGPALTFYFREALFALAEIERELTLKDPSGFKDILENAMLGRPGDWQTHYHGSALDLAYKRKYSFLDRSRYYYPDETVKNGIAKLIANINSNHIPETIISQYLPTAYIRLRSSGRAFSAENLLKSRVRDCIDDYLFATVGKDYLSNENGA